MDVNVQVWNLLERRFANGVPNAQALIWKGPAHCTSDTRHHGHERRAGRLVELTHIMKMLSWNSQRVARVKLP